MTPLLLGLRVPHHSLPGPHLCPRFQVPLHPAHLRAYDPPAPPVHDTTPQHARFSPNDDERMLDEE
jgi:hypothetical protein